MNNYRYIVRKEFFGALVYDKLLDSYLALDALKIHLKMRTFHLRQEFIFIILQLVT